MCTMLSINTGLGIWSSRASTLSRAGTSYRSDMEKQGTKPQQRQHRLTGLHVSTSYICNSYINFKRIHIRLLGKWQLWSCNKHSSLAFSKYKHLTTMDSKQMYHILPSCKQAIHHLWLYYMNKNSQSHRKNGQSIPINNKTLVITHTFRRPVA